MTREVYFLIRFGKILKRYLCPNIWNHLNTSSSPNSVCVDLTTAGASPAVL